MMKEMGAKELVMKLQEIAAKEGCDVEDLVSKYSGEEPEEEGEEDGSGKIGLIVARMKSAKDKEEEYA